METALRRRISELESVAAVPSWKSTAAVATDARVKRKEKAAAIVLSCSILGMTTEESLCELENRGLKRTKSFVSRVLSVAEDADKERLRGIMASYPEEFEGISDQQFGTWFEARRAAAARRGASGVSRAADSHGSRGGTMPALRFFILL